MGIFMREMKSQEDFKQIGEAMTRMRLSMSRVLVSILESGRKAKVFKGNWASEVTAEIILRILTCAVHVPSASSAGMAGMCGMNPDINEMKKFIIRSITDENK
jgi:hypothetical protein